MILFDALSKGLHRVNFHAAPDKNGFRVWQGLQGPQGPRGPMGPLGIKGIKDSEKYSIWCLKYSAIDFHPSMEGNCYRNVLGH